MYQTTINGTEVAFDHALVAKYDRPGPRYTSYPTAPQWHDTIDDDGYRTILQTSDAARPLSLYTHLPFCEEHCTFCGCSTVITKKKTVAIPYLKALHREIALVSAQLDPSRTVSQCHFGGGTPTYLSTPQLEQLWATFMQHFHFADNAEIGIEVDPRVTTVEQLEALRHLGFNRLSMGVQDFNPQVQAAINRHQSKAQTVALIDAGRRLGFASINVDLIYGLPHQTAASFRTTVTEMLALRPDRMACYNFAYVPWLKAQQRGIDPATLPSAEVKLKIWTATIRQCADAGYAMIGFDHFAKPDDELTKALHEGTLWRNFQGYTTKAGTDMLAFGITGIGDINGHYVQNVKKLTTYQEQLAHGHFPLERGCHMTREDHIRRHVMQELLCNQRITWQTMRDRFQIDGPAYFASELEQLRTLAADGLVQIGPGLLAITPLGRLFARNVAMIFDTYLATNHADTSRYSRTV